jgi:HTH-type transcriptional regulator/antitoxin HigA
MTMDIRPIRTEADYEATLEEIALLMVDDPMPGTPEGDRLDVLATLVQAYEAQHHPVLPPDPIEAIKFRMEQQGLTVADLILSGVQWYIDDPFEPCESGDPDRIFF